MNINTARHRIVSSGLFWRVFAAIALAIIFSTMVTAGLLYASADKRFERLYTQDYTGLSKRITTALDNDTLEQLQAALREEKHINLTVLAGKRPLGTPPPRPVLKKLSRDRKQEHKDKPHDFRGPHLFDNILQHRSKRYRVIATPSRQRVLDTARPAIIFALLATLVIASTAIAWMVTRPLRKVQDAARQIAAGDTSARVPKNVTKRRDSIGELGDDFNYMAERIQQLLNAQQELIRNVSHELRTPLARMQVATALAQENPDSAATKLQRIETEIVRLDTLIGSILSLSKSDTELAQQTHSPIHLDQLIQQVIDDARFEFEGRAMQFNPPDASYEVLGNSQQLQSAIENVLRNALRYSATDQPVDIQVNRDHKDLCVTILDNGPGVSKQDLDKLFDPFFRADKARGALDTGGHGVGLAITRSVVKNHNGTITAQNRNKGGLAVTIKLPAHSS